MLFADTVTRTFGRVTFFVVLIAAALYILVNLRQGKEEIGSEIELAPNRKPYYSDEELETKKLDRTLLYGLGFLVVCAVGLPLYWMMEPGRQSGATEGFEKRFASWGSQLFAPTAQGGFNCAGCHGAKGVGGVAAYTYVDARTGEVREVKWKAPALDTVLLKFNEQELTYILTYGRPFSPMSPWGTAGGGPMNDQQISNLVAYIKSIQLCDPAADGVCQPAQDNIQKAIDDGKAAAEKAGTAFNLGEFLFNLDTSSGTYSCARCHTKGWSYDDPQTAGGGALGPNLTGGGAARQFPLVEDQVAFIEAGSENGKKYGVQGQGSGRMPGFGKVFTEEQIKAIVDYERSL
ncbi:MAG: cytochrome c [Acidimicrobiia bacterium]